MEVLLPLSRDQQAVNQIQDDLSGTAVPALERLVFFGLGSWRADGLARRYDLSQSLHHQKMGPDEHFFSLEFKNKQAFRITINAMLEAAVLALSPEETVDSPGHLPRLSQRTLLSQTQTDFGPLLL